MTIKTCVIDFFPPVSILYFYLQNFWGKFIRLNGGIRKKTKIQSILSHRCYPSSLSNVYIHFFSYCSNQFATTKTKIADNKQKNKAKKMFSGNILHFLFLFSITFHFVTMKKNKKQMSNMYKNNFACFESWSLIVNLKRDSFNNIVETSRCFFDDDYNNFNVVVVVVVAVIIMVVKQVTFFFFWQSLSSA